MDLTELKALSDTDERSSVSDCEDSRAWARRWAIRIGIGITVFLALAHLLEGR